MSDLIRSETLLEFDAAAGVYRLALPITTRSETNQRGNWRNHHSRHAAQRQTASLIARATLPRDLRPRRIRFVRIAGWPLDQGNLAAAFKHVQDGLCDAMGLDDGFRGRIAWEYGQEPQAPGSGRREKPSVRVEIAIGERGSGIGDRERVQHDASETGGAA